MAELPDLGLARIEDVIVETLQDEDGVAEAEVDCQRDDGGHETSPDGASEVGDVADEPDGQEGEGDTFGGTLLVVLDELWHLESE